MNVSEFLVENQLTNSTQLFAKANEQKQAGKTDLANFVLSRSSKALNDLTENTWKMEGAVEKVTRSNVTRIETIREGIQAECLENCNGMVENGWANVKEQQATTFAFAETLRTLIIKGRGKHRNVMVTGPANRGKTFLFRPMEKLFKVFCNPAENKYAWVEVVDAEVTFLKDFRWCKEMICWKEMLLLLEDQPVHFPIPKNGYSKDVCLRNDTHVVATSKCWVVFERNKKSDELENEMMEAHWKVFQLTHQIPYD